MFNFSKVEPAVNLSKEWIYKQLDDTLIFTYYFGPFRLGKAYCSAFSKDRNPSTTFYMSNSGSILYYDFRSGQKLDAISFVMKKFNCSFREALNQIAADFGLINRSSLIVPQKVFIEAESVEKEAKKETLIQFIPAQWDASNLKFWHQYEITKEELIKEKVYPIKRLFLNHKEIRLTETAYAYPLVTEERTYVKVYNPGSSVMKWLSTIPLSEPFGLRQLPFKSDTVMITKSQKDRISLLKFFTDVIATQNESKASLTEKVQQLLLEKYKRRIIFWDNDETGVQSCKEFNELGFDYVNIPKEEYLRFGIKDASDYIAQYGLDLFKYFLETKNLI